MLEAGLAHQFTGRQKAFMNAQSCAKTVRRQNGVREGKMVSEIECSDWLNKSFKKGTHSFSLLTLTKALNSIPSSHSLVKFFIQFKHTMLELFMCKLCWTFNIRGLQKCSVWRNLQTQGTSCYLIQEWTQHTWHGPWQCLGNLSVCSIIHSCFAGDKCGHLCYDRCVRKLITSISNTCILISHCQYVCSLTSSAVTIKTDGCLFLW